MELQNKNYTISEQAGTRLDLFLASVCGVTRSQIHKWIKYGVVQLNGEAPKKHGVKLREGDEVALVFDDFEVEVKVELTSEEEALLNSVTVVHETDEYVVINKPWSLITHPTEMLEDKDQILHTVSVSAWALRHDETLWGIGEYANRPGIVHRLDKETSGLMVIAKTQKMFDHLKSQFKGREVQKKYRALVHGVIERDSFELDFDIAMGKDGKMAARPKVKAVTLKTVDAIQEGRGAYTHFTVIHRYTDYTLVEAHPKSGRTHQIRVHLYAYNHPIVSDPLYFNKKIRTKRDELLTRLFLHAIELGFTDLSGQKQVFESEIPATLQNFLNELPQ